MWLPRRRSGILRWLPRRSEILRRLLRRQFRRSEILRWLPRRQRRRSGILRWFHLPPGHVKFLPRRSGILRLRPTYLAGLLELRERLQVTKFVGDYLSPGRF